MATGASADTTGTAIGDVLMFRDQQFDCVDVRHYVRRDGRPATDATFTTKCQTCGWRYLVTIGSQHLTPGTFNPPQGCKAHRSPKEVDRSELSQLLQTTDDETDQPSER